MNVFIRELKANRKSLIIWSVCMFLLIVSGMAKVSSLSSGGQSMNQVFASMPYSVKALFGIGSFDLSTVSGYYAVMFLYIELTAAIHAVLLGSGIIAKEERDKTTEFLMTKPVSRTAVVRSKFLAALVNIAVLNLISLASSVAMVAAYNKGKDISAQIAATMLSMFFVQLLFLSLGAMLSAAGRRPKQAGSLAAGILLICFFIAKVTDMTDRLPALNFFTPFKYFSLKDLMAGKGLNPGYLALTLILTAVFTAVSFVSYKKRDLKV